MARYLGHAGYGSIRQITEESLMLLVGLTGNIGSGKSTVAQLFSERGATIIDADVLARRAVEVGTPAFRAIVERWGTSVLTADGAIDRAALRPDERGVAEEVARPAA